MTVKEAADHLKISVSPTYALLAAGKLRGTRHGLGRGTWRVSEEQIQEVPAAGRTPTGAGGPPGQASEAPADVVQRCRDSGK